MNDLGKKSDEGFEYWKTRYLNGELDSNDIRYVYRAYHRDLTKLDNGKNKKNKKGGKVKNAALRAIKIRLKIMKRIIQEKLRKVTKKMALKAAGYACKAAGKACKVAGKGLKATAKGMKSAAKGLKAAAEAMKTAAKSIEQTAQQLWQAYMDSIGASYGISALALPIAVGVYGGMLGTAGGVRVTALSCQGTATALNLAAPGVEHLGKFLETTAAKGFENLGKTFIDRAKQINTKVDVAKITREVIQESNREGNGNLGMTLAANAMGSGGNDMSGGMMAAMGANSMSGEGNSMLGGMLGGKETEGNAASLAGAGNTNSSAAASMPASGAELGNKDSTPVFSHNTSVTDNGKDDSESPYYDSNEGNGNSENRTFGAADEALIMAKQGIAPKRKNSRKKNGDRSQTITQTQIPNPLLGRSSGGRG